MAAGIVLGWLSVAPCHEAIALESPFKHSTHVPGDWLRGPEASRDCLGCHMGVDPSFFARQPSRKAGLETGCKRCHFTGELVSERRGDALRPEAGIFLHADHVKQADGTLKACKECHFTAERSLPDHFPVPTAPGFCLGCHDPESSHATRDLKATEPDKLSKFLLRLNDSEEMRTRFRWFSHADHLAVGPDRGAEWSKTCVDACHAGVLLSAPAAAMVSYAACASCHVSAGSSWPLPARSFKQQPFATRTASTFSHVDHLSPMVLAKSSVLREAGCSACHIADSTAKSFSVDPSYKGCVAGGCHETWAVERQAGVNEALSGEVPHAAVAPQRQCAGCHALGPLAAGMSLKTQRPSVSLERKRPNAFAAGDQEHPHVTGTKLPACARCHRAQDKALPSRIKKETFLHSTHLPARASGADCVPCHDGIATTTGPEEIGTRTGKVPTYREDSCKECHKGMPPLPHEEQPRQQDASVFAHSDHVGKQRKLQGGALAQMSCESCHPMTLESKAAGIGLLAGVAKCTLCHGHAQAPEITGKVSADYTGKCIRCHRTGLPTRGPELEPHSRDFVLGVEGGQFHPTPEVRPCKACHQSSDTGRLRLQPPEVFATGYFKGSSAGQFHSEERRHGSGVPKGTGCYCCHWGGPEDSSSVDIFRNDLRRAGYTRSFRDLRSRLGSILVDYPGVEGDVATGSFKACSTIGGAGK